MRISSIVLPVILFTGLFVGVQSFGMDLYENNGIEAEGIPEIENHHEDLNSNWNDQASDQDTWREEEGILERAAGVTLVPRIASDLLNNVSIMNSILDKISEYRWVPTWTSTMLSTIFSASIFFALVALWLRYRA